MNNNYPVKYAVLVVKVDGGWANNYEKVSIGNIVSKCYVIENSIRFFGDGTNKVTNKVFFPYANIESFKSGYVHPNQIRFNYYGYPCDLEEVEYLFDTFEEAKVVAEENNEKMRRFLLGNIPCYNNPNFNAQYLEIQEEFNRELEMCRQYEEFISENTSDMKISESSVKVFVKN